MGPGACAPPGAGGRAPDDWASPPDDRILSIDAGGIKYWTGHPGVVTPDDPIDTIKAVADAYDIRWLVLERDGTVEALKPVLTGDQRPPWIGPAVFTRRRRRTAARPLLAPLPGLRAAMPRQPRPARHDAAAKHGCRPAGVFVVALIVRAGLRRARSSCPTPEDTAYYVGVARNLVEGRGLVTDAIWSYQTPPLVFPRPAFEVWLPLPTFLAAIPMAIARRDRSRRRRSRRPRRRARARSSPGGSPRTSPWSADCRRSGRGRWRSAPA